MIATFNAFVGYTTAWDCHTHYWVYEGTVVTTTGTYHAYRCDCGVVDLRYAEELQ